MSIDIEKLLSVSSREKTRSGELELVTKTIINIKTEINLTASKTKGNFTADQFKTLPSFERCNIHSHIFQVLSFATVIIFVLLVGINSILYFKVRKEEKLLSKEQANLW